MVIYLIDMPHGQTSYDIENAFFLDNFKWTFFVVMTTITSYDGHIHISVGSNLVLRPIKCIFKCYARQNKSADWKLCFDPYT